MKRYYKTDRDSKTGLKIKAILDRASEFDAHVEILQEKYKFKKIWNLSYYFKNIDAVEFNEEPDMTVWKEVEGLENAFYPRRRHNKNKDLLNDFKDLKKLQIRRDELDKIIGHNDFFNRAGFYFVSPGIYIFIVESDWKCNIPEDCEEITNLEYDKLTLE